MTTGCQWLSSSVCRCFYKEDTNEEGKKTLGNNRNNNKRMEIENRQVVNETGVVLKCKQWKHTSEHPNIDSIISVISHLFFYTSCKDEATKGRNDATAC